MSTTFVQPQDLMKIRELRLRQEIAQTQAQSFGYAMQAELGRLYLKLGLQVDDSINVDTGVVTLARPKPESDEDAHMDAGVPSVGPVPVDPGEVAAS